MLNNIISKTNNIHKDYTKITNESSSSDSYELQIIPKPKKRKLLKKKLIESSWDNISSNDENDKEYKSLILKQPIDICKHLNTFDHEETTETICNDCGLVIYKQKYIVEKEFGENKNKEFRGKNKHARRYMEYINTFTGIIKNGISHVHTKYEAFKIIDSLYECQCEYEIKSNKKIKNERCHKIKTEIQDIKIGWNDIQKTYKKLGYIDSTKLIWRSFTYQILGYNMPVIMKSLIAESRFIDLWIRNNFNKITVELNLEKSKETRGRPKTTKLNLTKKFNSSSKFKEEIDPYKHFYLQTPEDSIPSFNKKDDETFGDIVYNFLFKDQEHKEQIEYENHINQTGTEMKTDSDLDLNKEFNYGESDESKIRIDYLIYKKCQLDQIKNWENIPLKMTNKTIIKYDKMWKIVCRLNNLTYHPTEYQCFRIIPNKLKAKWKNCLLEHQEICTGNPRKVKRYDNNGNIKMVDYNAPKEKEKIPIKTQKRLSPNRIIEETKYYPKPIEKQYTNVDSENDTDTEQFQDYPEIETSIDPYDTDEVIKRMHIWLNN